MDLADPIFPPLFTGHATGEAEDPMRVAIRGAAEGLFSAGDLVWSRSRERISLALVLEPEVPRSRASEMLFLAMVATGDALGALTPPEFALTFEWPAGVRANGARVGRARLAVSDLDDESQAPLWLVIGLDLALAPLAGPREPGETPDRTSLVDEGAVDIDRSRALEALSRHLLSWIHTWDVDGFAPVLENWLFRADGYRRSHAVETAQGRVRGTFLGLDEQGNMLLKQEEGEGGETLSLSLLANLSPEEKLSPEETEAAAR
ncbi:biotin/lipoate--protein ligase family protein [Stappia indica]|uniref:biotin/lipoate--protein ligase family protein n=1 Tax=Stappia indica TaxID=538381 RepID=UPI001CD6E0FB|nr:biotin/lipoate--protein ligase family protein [Stappia indica]MCA1297275.1 biotin/lipoate--protein ligase family protein [Stappia indica]